jgi:hypothetical protein
MDSSFSVNSSSPNYNLDFPRLPRKNTRSTVPIMIKMLSGDLICIEITRNTTCTNLYDFIYQYLRGFEEFQSLKFIDLMLYREGDEEKDNKLLEHNSLLVCPKKDELFLLYIESYYFNVNLSDETVLLIDNNENLYHMINISIVHKSESSPDEMFSSQDYIVRRPTSKGDLFIPQIWSKNHIKLRSMYFHHTDIIENYNSALLIDNPDPSLVITNITHLVSDFISNTPYFNTKITHGLQRIGRLYKQLSTNWNKLMEFYFPNKNGSNE